MEQETFNDYNFLIDVAGGDTSALLGLNMLQDELLLGDRRGEGHGSDPLACAVAQAPIAAEM